MLTVRDNEADDRRSARRRRRRLRDEAVQAGGTVALGFGRRSRGRRGRPGRPAGWCSAPDEIDLRHAEVTLRRAPARAHAQGVRPAAVPRVARQQGRVRTASCCRPSGGPTTATRWTTCASSSISSARRSSPSRLAEPRAATSLTRAVAVAAYSTLAGPSPAETGIRAASRRSCDGILSAVRGGVNRPCSRSASRLAGRHRRGGRRRPSADVHARGVVTFRRGRCGRP